MRPQPLLIASAVLLAALAAPVGAHPVGPTTLGGITPALAEVPAVGTFGLAFCQSVNPAAPLFCGANGLGAFFDVSAIDAPGANHYHSHATGTCKVVQGSVQLLGPDYVFACATDRNDDGLVTDQEVCVIEDDTAAHAPSGVTNHDECSGEAAITNGGANENWADDWVYGNQAQNTVTLCFQDDVRGFTPSLLDDLGAVGSDVHALNQAVNAPTGGVSGWDEVIVFVGIKVPPSLLSHVGTFTATLSMTGAAGTCGVNVSAHGTLGNTRTSDNAASLHDGDCHNGVCHAVLADLA